MNRCHSLLVKNQKYENRNVKKPITLLNNNYYTPRIHNKVENVKNVNNIDLLDDSKLILKRLKALSNTKMIDKSAKKLHRKAIMKNSPRPNQT